MPGAEHVSAILFFKQRDCCRNSIEWGKRVIIPAAMCEMLRWEPHIGTIPTRNQPLGFVYEVVVTGMASETWQEGTVLMHNPNGFASGAEAVPGHVSRGILGGGAGRQLLSGQPLHPYASTTEVYDSRIPTRELQKRARIFCRGNSSDCLRALTLTRQST